MLLLTAALALAARPVEAVKTDPDGPYVMIPAHVPLFLAPKDAAPQVQVLPAPTDPAAPWTLLTARWVGREGDWVAIQTLPAADPRLCHDVLGGHGLRLALYVHLSDVLRSTTKPITIPGAEGAALTLHPGLGVMARGQGTLPHRLDVPSGGAPSLSLWTTLPDGVVDYTFQPVLPPPRTYGKPVRATAPIRFAERDGRFAGRAWGPLDLTSGGGKLEGSSTCVDWIAAVDGATVEARKPPKVGRVEEVEAPPPAIVGHTPLVWSDGHLAGVVGAAGWTPADAGPCWQVPLAAAADAARVEVCNPPPAAAPAAPPPPIEAAPTEAAPAPSTDAPPPAGPPAEGPPPAEAAPPAK